MNAAKDLMGAFEQYYSTEKDERHYSRKMAQTICDSYAWISEGYKTSFYEEVVRNFTPTATRPLPDMAALSAAERALPPAATLAKPPRETKAELERTDQLIRDRINAKAKREGEVNHEERERIREKMRRGEATRWEVRWITVIDKYGGDWGRAMRELGPIDGVEIRPARPVRSAEDEAEVHW